MALFGTLFGGGSSGDTTAPDAPSLAFASATATSVTLTHTAPGDGDYATTHVHYGTRGGARIGSVSGAGGTIAVTGLTAATAYWFVAESRDASTNKSIPSNVVLASTLQASAIPAQRVVDLVAEACEGVSSPPTTYKGRIWRPAWDKRLSALVRLVGITDEEGHGGMVRRRYGVEVALRAARRDTDGKKRQEDISAAAEAIRNALNLADPADFSTSVTGLFQIRVDSPISIADSPDDLDVDYIETTILVELWTFETA